MESRGREDPRLIALSGGLGSARLSAQELRFERLDLALRDREGRMRTLQRRLILEKRRSRLLQAARSLTISSCTRAICCW